MWCMRMELVCRSDGGGGGVGARSDGMNVK